MKVSRLRLWPWLCRPGGRGNLRKSLNSCRPLLSRICKVGIGLDDSYILPRNFIILRYYLGLNLFFAFLFPHWNWKALLYFSCLILKTRRHISNGEQSGKRRKREISWGQRHKKDGINSQKEDILTQSYWNPEPQPGQFLPITHTQLPRLWCPHIAL